MPFDLSSFISRAFGFVDILYFIFITKIPFKLISLPSSIISAIICAFISFNNLRLYLSNLNSKILIFLIVNSVLSADLLLSKNCDKMNEQLNNINSANLRFYSVLVFAKLAF